jgi:hypothetical protein
MVLIIKTSWYGHTVFLTEWIRGAAGRILEALRYRTDLTFAQGAERLAVGLLDITSRRVVGSMNCSKSCLSHLAAVPGDERTGRGEVPR